MAWPFILGAFAGIGRGDAAAVDAGLAVTRRILGLCLAVLAGCSPPLPPDCPPALAGRDVVYVLGRGWHTEIGLPAEELHGGLEAFRTIYPGARTVMFGYGKRTFMVAPPDDISEYMLGPVPGPAVIEVVGLNASPPEAYGPDGIVTLVLPPGGAEKISAFLWNDLRHNEAGGPLLVAAGHFPGSEFYGARSGYGLFHTCNTWTAEALAAAGLPVDADALVFAHQTMSRVASAATAQCRAAGALGG